MDRKRTNYTASHGELEVWSYHYTLGGRNPAPVAVGSWNPIISRVWDTSHVGFLAGFLVAIVPVSSSLKHPKCYPPGNDHISPTKALLSRWFSFSRSVGYVSSVDGKLGFPNLESFFLLILLPWRFCGVFFVFLWVDWCVFRCFLW